MSKRDMDSNRVDPNEAKFRAEAFPTALNRALCQVHGVHPNSPHYPQLKPADTTPPDPAPKRG